MLAEGKYRARAAEWSQVTINENSQNEEIRVMFGLTDEGSHGETITWYGYFSEATAERTVESLRIMGWTGDDITDVQGLDANEVQIVVKHEPKQDGSGIRARVAFVNRLGGVFVGQPLTDDRKKAFTQRMKGLVIASKQSGARSSPNPPAKQNSGGGADFPFGANQPPPQRSAPKL